MNMNKIHGMLNAMQLITTWKKKPEWIKCPLEEEKKNLYRNDISKRWKREIMSQLIAANYEAISLKGEFISVFLFISFFFIFYPCIYKFYLESRYNIKYVDEVYTLQMQVWAYLSTWIFFNWILN